MTLLTTLSPSAAITQAAAPEPVTVTVWFEQVDGTWRDISADLISGNTSRGKNKELDVFQAGTCQLILRNDKRQYDPNQTLQGVVLDGTSGCYTATPDSVASSFTTSTIDVRVRLTATSWASGTQTIVGKWNTTGNQRTWLLTLDPTGHLTFQGSADGLNTTQTSSTVVVPFAAGTAGWVRVTLAGNILNFYTSASTATSTNGVAWTQLGTANIVFTLASFFDSTADNEVGAHTAGTTDRLTGAIHTVEVLSGVTTIVNPDFAGLPWWSQSSTVTSSPDGAGNMWSVHGTAVVSGSPYGGSILPMRRMRVMTTVNNGLYAIFTGYVDSWQQIYTGPHSAQMQVDMTDAFKVLVAARRGNAPQKRS